MSEIGLSRDRDDRDLLAQDLLAARWDTLLNLVADVIDDLRRR